MGTLVGALLAVGTLVGDLLAVGALVGTAVGVAVVAPTVGLAVGLALGLTGLAVGDSDGFDGGLFGPHAQHAASTSLPKLPRHLGPVYPTPPTETQ